MNRRTAAALASLALAGLAATTQPKAARKEDAMTPKTRHSDPELKKRLTPEQYHVTRENGTEPPFRNAFWDNHEPGLYVDVVSGEPLFSSKDKFDSGTGWPSFTRPVEPGSVAEKEDRTLWMRRVEARSKEGDSHLGHVFDDGPAPTGKRYCINSASLRFIPAKKLKEEGFERYASLFEEGQAPAQAKAGTARAAVKTQKAVFAAGCFWGVQAAFDKIPGVVSSRVGYTGGKTKSPTYKQVCGGDTGHAEAVEVEFDPARVSYAELLRHFWKIHDPTTPNRQGPDVGEQYRSAVFHHSEEQKREAQKSIAELEKSGRLRGKVTTQVAPAAEFWPAEDYHQKYHQKQGTAGCHLPRD